MIESKDRSFGNVLGDIAGNIQEIVRSEGRLAQVELKEEAAKTIRAGRPLGAGIALALYGLGFLLLAAVYALSTFVSPWLAAAMVGGVVLMAGLILIAIGKSRLQLVSRPEKTIGRLKENLQWAKNHSR